ncbi:MAG: porin family protein [Catalinimonas sp.]
MIGLAPAFGQLQLGRKGNNLPGYENRLLHYGFFVAVNYSTFRAQHSSYFQDQLDGTLFENIEEVEDVAVANPILALQPKGFGGFTLGFVLNLHLGEHFDLRFTPGASFYQRQVEYTFSGNLPDEETNSSTQLSGTIFSFIETPLLLKFKSARRQNVRLYLVGGVRPGLEVGARRNETSDEVLRTENTDFSIEYGIGADLYYPLFKFSPELRFSHGISDMKLTSTNPFARSLRRLTTHTVTLYFFFE